MVDVVILAAGVSSRFNSDINKIYMPLMNKTVIEHSLDKFIKIKDINKIIVVYNHHDELLLDKVLRKYQEYNIIKVLGGSTRSISLKNALAYIDGDKLLVHDGARCFTNILDIQKIIELLDFYDCVSLYHDAVDAIKYRDGHINKKDVKLTSTPQGFNKKAYQYLKEYIKEDSEDDLEIFEKTEFLIYYLKETSRNNKITYFSDLDDFSYQYRVGHSLDFHTFDDTKVLKLGGIKIAQSMGLAGHSDGDSLLHAISEAIMGALHLKDLGERFPDNDPKYKDIDSSYFLKEIKEDLINLNYEIVNIDAIIYLEKPKLSPYKSLMEENIAKILNIPSALVNVKATTMEKKGIIGRSEGIAAEAVVLIKKKNLFK